MRRLVPPVVCLLAAIPLAGQPAPPPPPSPSMTVAEAEALAREIGPKVEQLRGLKFKSPVMVKVVDDAAARSHFTRRAGKFWPQERIRIEQTAFAQLGLIPPGSDLAGTLFHVLEEQVGGFYDPDIDTFFVLDDMPRSGAPLIMAHELTHALDDQHFSIDALLEKVGHDEDRSTALGAVIEGSGTLVMMFFVAGEQAAGRLSQQVVEDMQQSEAGRAERLRAAPVYLQRGLLAPYVLGQTFMLRGDLMGGIMAGVKPADIDRTFNDPPPSSEQILHPEKYWDAARRDPPAAIDVGDLSGILGAGWKLTGKGTLGEINLAVLTGSGAPDTESIDAFQTSRWTNEGAAGWGGDQWHLYARGEQRVTLAVTWWDTEADAVQFEAALTPVPGRVSMRRGRAVTLVAGDAGGNGEALGRAALGKAAPQPASGR